MHVPILQQLCVLEPEPASILNLMRCAVPVMLLCYAIGVPYSIYAQYTGT